MSAICDNMPWAPPLWRWRTLPAQVLAGGYRTVEAAAKAGSTRANSSCVSPVAARNSRGLSWKVAKVRIEQVDTISDNVYSALPKHTEAQVLGRQVRCSWTSVDVNSHQGQSNHSGEPCGARYPGGTRHGALSHTADDGSPAYVSACTKDRWRWSHRNILAPPM